MATSQDSSALLFGLTLELTALAWGVPDSCRQTVMLDRYSYSISVVAFLVIKWFPFLIFIRLFSIYILSFMRLYSCTASVSLDSIIKSKISTKYNALNEFRLAWGTNVQFADDVHHTIVNISSKVIMKSPESCILISQNIIYIVNTV